MVTIFTEDEVIPEENKERRNRKQAISTKYLSLPDVNQKTSVQGNQTTGYPGQARVRSFTLPTSCQANKQQTTDLNTTPGID